jgi:hypothetical protein
VTGIASKLCSLLDSYDRAQGEGFRVRGLRFSRWALISLAAWSWPPAPDNLRGGISPLHFTEISGNAAKRYVVILDPFPHELS